MAYEASDSAWRSTRTCSQCQTEQPLDNFWTSYDKRYDLRRTRSYCKDCGKKYNDYVKYKLPADKRRELELSQNNRCAICESESRLVVDHNHETGEVRALLCYPCNTGIGLLRDDAEILKRAWEYLSRREG